MNEILTKRVLGLSYYFAGKYARRGTDLYDELVCQCNLELVRMALAYDPNRACAFSTYAMHSLKLYLIRRMTVGLITTKDVYDRCQDRLVSPYNADGTDWIPDHRHDPTPEERETNEATQWVLSKLTPFEREVFVGYYRDEIPCGTLAKRHGVSRYWMAREIPRIIEKVRTIVASMARRRTIRKP